MIQTPVFWLLLGASAFIFWALPRRYRDGFLALASYAYLASLEPVTVTVLIGWTLLVFYFTPQAVAGKGAKRLILPGLILAILTYLVWHKYIPQLSAVLSRQSTAAAVVIPLGISYFTFKLIHYAVEVARGNIQDRSLQRFFCYIFLFPIFTAGPIERFDHFLANRDETWRLQTSVEGITRIAHGLIKIFVIARVLNIAGSGVGIESVEDLVSRLGELDTHQVWGYLVLAYLYAYIDFSAYSDIAIGASRLYGFRIMENFRFPIFAWNISDFWRRWHMTLVAWCQAYVYMPMIGLTRRPYVAVYCTFIAMGLWHAGSWNWLFWGLYHATGVSFYLTWGRIKRYHGWKSSIGDRLRYVGIPLTFAFVTGSYAFSTTAGHGAWPAVRVFAKLFFINL